MDDDDHHFREAGDYRGDGRAANAQRGGAEMAEDQHPVQKQIDQNGTDAGKHRRPGFTGFPEGSGVDLDQGEGNQADQHYPQITDAVLQRAGQVAAVAVPL